MKYILTFFSLLGVLSGSIPDTKAQTGQYLYLDNRPPVTIQGTQLDFPWAGGFNSPIFNPIDLNGDGLLDLMTFDRTCNRLTLFVNTGVTGQSSYRYAPEYMPRFPVLQKWVRTADFDCDGDLDLFTYGNKSIAVYRNDYTSGTGIVFSLVTTHLDTWFGTFTKEISGSDTNVPEFYDIGGDGDIDVLTFSTSGNNIEYYRNYWTDSAGTCGGFKYNYESACWGYMQLDQLANIADLNIVCRGNVIDNANANRVANGNRHSGSFLSGFDEGCDGDLDLINGDILGSNLLYLENGGTPDSAYMVNQDSLFPLYNSPVLLNNLPSAAYMDIDNDQVNDLVVTPSSNSGEDFNNVLFYKNVGTNCANVFNYTTNRLLVDRMIDVGSSALVAIADIDQDGLKDMIIGNDRYFNANPSLSYARLAWFKNTGTATQPAFTLQTDDWLGLSSLQLYALYPTFGDLDGDGDIDLIIGSGPGDLFYYTNTAPAGTPCNFSLVSAQYQGLQCQSNPAPQIVDVNRDGLPDLLVGNRTGRLRYFQNSGTSSNPVFSLTNAFLGGVTVTKVGAVAGFSVPQLYERNGSYELLVGSESGYIYQYANIDGNLAGTFTLVDSMYQAIYEPKVVSIASTDIDGDGKRDLLTGNLTGGVHLYTQSTGAAVHELTGGNDEISIYPNPAHESVTVQLRRHLAQQRFTISVLDVTGKLVHSQESVNDLVVLPFESFQPGYYLLKVNYEGYSFVKKVIKQ